MSSGDEEYQIEDDLAWLDASMNAYLTAVVPGYEDGHAPPAPSSAGEDSVPRDRLAFTATWVVFLACVTMFLLSVDMGVWFAAVTSMTAAVMSLYAMYELAR